jgi:1-deoxy-D-xylulose-5-phosphate synthase
MVYTGMKLEKPVFIRYPKEPGIGVPMDVEFKELSLGKSEVLRDGIDGVILAVGTLVYRALEAAKKLHAEAGIDLTVINVRYIKPLDTELILKVVREKKGRLNNNGKIITIEDGIRVGGFGTLIRELLVSESIKDYSILSLGVPEEDIVVASREELLAKYHLNVDGIFAEIKKLFME